VLALFWNRDDYADPTILEILLDAYRKLGIEDRAVNESVAEPPHGWPESEIAASSEFADREIRTYHWTRRQSVADHVARLNTVSAHLILPAEVREALTRDMLDSLTARTSGASAPLAHHIACGGPKATSAARLELSDSRSTDSVAGSGTARQAD
jgi:hypothetical protein